MCMVKTPELWVMVTLYAAYPQGGYFGVRDGHQPLRGHDTQTNAEVPIGNQDYCPQDV